MEKSPLAAVFFALKPGKPPRPDGRRAVDCGEQAAGPLEASVF